MPVIVLFSALPMPLSGCPDERQVLDVRGKGHRERAFDAIDPFECELADGVARVVDDVPVVALAALEPIGAGTAVQEIVAREAGQRVIARQSEQKVVECRS